MHQDSTPTTPALPRRSTRLHPSPDSVALTLTDTSTGGNLEHLIRFTSKPELAKKDDFIVEFYFVNSTQAQRTHAQKGLNYFAGKPKRFVYTGNDFEVTAHLNPLIQGGLGDAGPANSYLLVFKTAKHIGNCANYLNFTLPAIGGGCEMYLRIDNSQFFRLL
jgi:hypothetical protein